MSAGGEAAAAAEAWSWRRAAIWLACLAPFFYLTYGAANAYASLRADVPSVVFAWERHIPFLAWTIVPYWTINGFYAASLFVCTSNRELDRHGLRLLTAQVLAVAIFLAWPLRFSLPQPVTTGVFGFMFGVLTSFDRPFNQAPSLHIALLLILWPLYSRHLPPRVRWALHGWFALVGVSVLTTYQHHFVDIPTGALLGAFCLWLWPEHGPSPLADVTPTSDPRRRRLAARYAVAGIVVAAVGRWSGGAGLWLFWPACSLWLVAANYAVLGAEGFQKDTEGRMSLASRLLLAPYLAGAFLNSRIWTRLEPDPVPVAGDVWLGRLPRRRDAARFASVVDVSAELPGAEGGARWVAIPMLDLVAPTAARLRAAARLVESRAAAGPLLVCCALGYSRSAATVAAWLTLSGRAESVSDAIAMVRRVRPRIVIDDALKAAILDATERAA